MIDTKTLKKNATKYLLTHAHNYVESEDAIRDELIGMQIYDEPVFAIGDATDPLFNSLKRQDVIHPDYWLPRDWNPEAKRVISYFLPYTEQIKRANAADLSKPVDEWLHGRIEGQEMLDLFGEYLKNMLGDEGFYTVLPSTDPRFTMLALRKSNWSERHTGFICGIGTFGLSKGIITKKGMAGRMGSIITTAKFPVTEREYVKIYEYCTKCRKCQRNCPAGAIDISRGMHHAKSHEICDPFVEGTKTVHRNNTKEKIRYGCGKCQVSVPCESRIPNRKFREK